MPFSAVLESKNDTTLRGEGPSIAGPHCNRRSSFELLRGYGRTDDVRHAGCRNFLFRLGGSSPQRRINNVSRYYRNTASSFGPGGISPTVKTLIIVCCAVFLLQQFDAIAGGTTFVANF